MVNKYHRLLLVFFLLSGCQSRSPVPNTASDVQMWLTLGDRSVLLAKQRKPIRFSDTTDGNTIIDVNDRQTYQTMHGFGYTLTGGSASHIHKLPARLQNALLHELFSTKKNGIGISYIRVSVGASDLDSVPFTYNDIAPGATDPDLQNFSLRQDMDALIPVLKKIVAIQPSIQILASPWSAPAWMKTKGHLKGGSLKREHYSTYARYLVKYIRAMKALGIRINALTPQNEPLHGGNNPSMVMQAGEQAVFIAQNLGPELEKAGLKTKIIIYDHNADKPEYPMSILADTAAAKYVDGSAFHLYAGHISALSAVHNAFPEKHIYFTEQWTGGPGNFAADMQWHVANLHVGAVRNWSRTVLEWNLAADADYRPHTQDGGCTSCLGALTINGHEIIRNSPYYSVAHSSKFVPPGSVRVASSAVEGLPNVAYKTPDGKKVMVVVNAAATDRSFKIKYAGKSAPVHLRKGAVATLVWR